MNLPSFSMPPEFVLEPLQFFVAREDTMTPASSPPTSTLGDETSSNNEMEDQETLLFPEITMMSEEDSSLLDDDMIANEYYKATASEDILVEPTPIDPKSAIVVDKLPLDHLMKKQDIEKYDWFMKTFSSYLKAEDEGKMLPSLEPSSISATELLSNPPFTFNAPPFIPPQKENSCVASWTPVPATMVSSMDSQYFESSLSKMPLVLKNEIKNSLFGIEEINEEDQCDESDVSSVDETDIPGKKGANNLGGLRTLHMEQWNQRYQELVQFQRMYQHCLVPLNWPANPPLGHWVKRQRYQYRIKHEGKRSTLTDEREEALELLGFIWDSHGVNWEERWNELQEYREEHGHCNVPKKYEKNPQLPVWVKCQRRQYKLFRLGKKSHMTKSRIEKLQSLNFVFDPRPHHKNAASTNW